MVSVAYQCKTLCTSPQGEGREGSGTSLAGEKAVVAETLAYEMLQTVSKFLKKIPEAKLDISSVVKERVEKTPHDEPSKAAPKEKPTYDKSVEAILKARLTILHAMSEKPTCDKFVEARTSQDKDRRGQRR